MVNRRNPIMFPQPVSHHRIKNTPSEETQSMSQRQDSPVPHDNDDPVPASLRPVFVDRIGELVRFVVTPDHGFPDMGPGKPTASVRQIQQDLRSDKKFTSLAAQSAMCFEAGILLLCGHLDASHEISQTLEGKGNPPTADYWHALMHRREPDFGNAAWWFRRVGHHPAFDRLSEQLLSWLSEGMATPDQQHLAETRLIAERQWNPQAMIELCRTGLTRPTSIEARTARHIQYLEILNLLAYTLQ
jgi:hypothetical protein